MKTVITLMAVLLISASFASKGGSEKEKTIGQQAYTLADTKLTDKIQSHEDPKGNLEERYSRCPSGYRTNITQTATAAADYSYGKVTVYNGCRGTEVCQFRIRLSDKTVDVKQPDGTYIPAADWLEAKYAKKNAADHKTT